MWRQVNRTGFFNSQKTHPSQGNPDTLFDNVNYRYLRVPYKNLVFKFLSYLAIISVLNQAVVHSRYAIQHRKLELMISRVFAPHFLRFLGAIYTPYRAEPAMFLPYNSFLWIMVQSFL